MRPPRWNIAAAVLQPLGIVMAYVAGYVFSPPGSLNGLVVIWRSRPLVPAFALLLAVEFVARRLVTAAHPIERAAGTTGTVLNGALFGVLVAVVGLGWSRRSGARGAAARSPA